MYRTGFKEEGQMEGGRRERDSGVDQLFEYMYMYM